MASSASPLPGAPYLHHAHGELHLEGVALSQLALQYGTPLFAYSKAAMLHALGAYQKGLAGRKATICYAMKANSNLAILQLFARAGCGFDVVSGGELARVLAAGGRADQVIFSGVGKTRQEMEHALKAGIACFNVESLAELEVLNEVALRVGRRAPVSLRVNPNVDAKTHPYISTGLKGNKFGISHEDAVAAYVGNPTAFNALGQLHTGTLLRTLGVRRTFSSGTQDCANKFAVARQVYGFPFTQPFPDLDNTNCLIITGANPVISKSNGAPYYNPGRRLKEAVKGGMKLIVVDPRQIDLVSAPHIKADVHLQLKPGTNVALINSIAHVVVTELAVATRLVAKLLVAARAWATVAVSRSTNTPSG